MPASALEDVYKKVEKYLPDMLRTPGAFFGFCGNGNTMTFEVGQFQGVFWLSNIVIGWRATIHIVLWDKEVKGQYKRAQEIIRELFQLLRLKRLEIQVPERNERACKYAERLGFEMEGVLRKHAIYDGDYVDVAVYSILREEL